MVDFHKHKGKAQMAYDNSDRPAPVGRLKLDYTASDNTPVYTGDLLFFDGNWLSTKLWKPNKEGTKLALSGNCKEPNATKDDKPRFYVSLMKADAEKSYVFYGWLKERTDDDEYLPAYRVYLYPDEVRSRSGNVASYNVSGMVVLDEQAGDTKTTTKPAAKAAPASDYDDIPF